jgi:hypothetical protein
MARIIETGVLALAVLALAVLVPQPAAATANDATAAITGAEAWRSKRLVRAVLSSVAEAKVFGGQMACKAKWRWFFDVDAKVFLRRGLAWNWLIWKKHFLDFTLMLDFVHVLSYLFVAAKAV